MKRALTPFFALLMGGAIAAPAFAQTATGVPLPKNPGWNARTAPGEYGEHHPYVREFNGYLDAHPNEAAELSKNPGLVDNPRYLANHPDLHSYLRAHPQVAEKYKHHPEAFMHRERRYENIERRYDKRHHLPPH